MAEITNKQKLATVSYVEAILRKLQDWMPFKRKNGGILQDSKDENGEQTLQTTNNGEIALGKYNKSEIDTLLSVGISLRVPNANTTALIMTTKGIHFLTRFAVGINQECTSETFCFRVIINREIFRTFAHAEEVVRREFPRTSHSFQVA